LKFSKDDKDFAGKHDTEQWNKIKEWLEYTKRRQMEALKLALQKEEEKNAMETRDSTVSILREFDAETARLEAELTAELQKERDGLDAKHAKTTEDNEKLWTSDKKIKHYNRLSPNLCALKKQLNTMLVQGRFKDAGEVQQIYDSQKEMETASNHEMMQHDFDEVHTWTENAHAEEDRYFAVCSDVRHLQLRMARRKERKHLEHRLAFNESTKEIAGDGDRVWNLTKRARLDKSARGTGLPSTKMTRGELPEPDIELLSLPALNLRRKPPKAADPE
jgi:hypothetical protein